MGERTYLMGILNVTPDSFSDGGYFNHVDAALARADVLWQAGADAIDLGGESTRPGYVPIDVETEWTRVAAILRALRARSDGVLSIDTQKAEVARRALEEGVDVVNDIWGLARDPDMLPVLAGTQAGLVMMYNRHPAFEPGTVSMQAICQFFTCQLARAQAAGVAGDRILVDPGLGFGYAVEDHWMILQHLGTCVGYGGGLLVGPSRKRFLGTLTGLPAEARDRATAAVAALAVGQGVDVVRVHNVAAVYDAVRVADRWVRRG